MASRVSSPFSFTIRALVVFDVCRLHMLAGREVAEKARIKMFPYMSTKNYSYFMHHTFSHCLRQFFLHISTVVVCSFFRTSTLFENEKKTITCNTSSSGACMQPPHTKKKSYDSKKIENIQRRVGCIAHRHRIEYRYKTGKYRYCANEIRKSKKKHTKMNICIVYSEICERSYRIYCIIVSSVDILQTFWWLDVHTCVSST